MTKVTLHGEKHVVIDLVSPSRPCNLNYITIVKNGLRFSRGIVIALFTNPFHVPFELVIKLIPRNLFLLSIKSPCISDFLRSHSFRYYSKLILSSVGNNVYLTDGFNRFIHVSSANVKIDL